MSALIIATALCLRDIITSATMMQYRPSNFASNTVSGDMHPTT